MVGILDDLGVEYRLGTGTLLGAVREGQFIEWDWDIGLDVPAEQLLPAWRTIIERAKSSGFLLRHSEKTWLNGKVIFEVDDMEIELMGWRRDNFGNRRRRRLFLPGDIWAGLTEVRLLDTAFTTYAEYERYLEHFYGEWRIPVQASEKSDKNTYLESRARKRDYVDAIFVYPQVFYSRLRRILKAGGRNV